MFTEIESSIGETQRTLGLTCRYHVERIVGMMDNPSERHESETLREKGVHR